MKLNMLQNYSVLNGLNLVKNMHYMKTLKMLQSEAYIDKLF